MEYYIFVTNECNLNCQYCSVLMNLERGNIPPTPTYSISSLNKFVDSLQREKNDDTADIIFFGGEPTLNYEFISQVIKAQKTLQGIPYKFRYMLHTNGLLLKEIPNDIIESLDSIMLSINYNMVPHAHLNSSYFQTIVDSVNYIKHLKSIPIVARLTITETTSLYSEIALFNSLFDAIYWQIENKYEFEDYKKFYDTYTYELTLSFQLWLGYLKRGILIRLIPFIASAVLNYKDIFPHGFCCGYNESMIYIQTNGKCYTCAEDMITAKNLIGNIQNKVGFEQFGLHDTICSSCKYINMCMGRCGRMHREFKKEHVQEYCRLNMVLFNLIKQHAMEIKSYCEKYKINLSIEDPIFHYTEYTP